LGQILIDFFATLQVAAGIVQLFLIEP